MNELGTILGVRFDYESTELNGFVLTLTNDETEEQLLHRRFVGYTVWEAVIKACFEVWDKEIQEHEDYELPKRIAKTLGIPEEYEENIDE